MGKIERAIEDLEDLISCESISSNFFSEVHGKHLHIAITALEKQIPYKPQKYQQYDGKCKCGAIFLDKSTNYCGHCGQKLDWEDKHE